MLQITDLTHHVGGRRLFDGASLTVNAREHVGLVGRNGTGKSTLLKVIEGELQPDGGRIDLTGGWHIGRVRQEAPAGPESLLDTVLAADRERTRLIAEAETSENAHRLGEEHARLDDIDAHAAPARAARILAGLGFDEAAQARPCAEFSGGWRMRVALAALLFSKPDLLLLDEPTNHLDLESTLWLEGYLRNWPGTMLLVSHDRRLLNGVVGRIAHLEHGRLTAYQGNYDRFERTRREQLERQADLRARQETERKRIQAFVDRFRAKASKARQAQSRLKMLARMQPIPAAEEGPGIRFDFPAPEELAPPILRLEGATAGYAADNPVLRHLDLRLDMDDRVALLGANGNGKSTLARLLTGRLQPLSGRRIAAPRLRTGYFAQDQAEELDLEATPLQHMARVLPRATETQQRAQLGRFGFQQEKAEVRVGDLSGGEKARLLFALMSREAPHLMVLDEPSNHLDVDAREALVQALNTYPGAVVLITHDPHLIELVADRLWLVSGGTVRPFDGDLEDYRRHLVEERRAARTAAGTGKSGRAAVSKKDKRRRAAESRATTAGLRRRAKEAEAELERLHARKRAIEAKLADSALYDGPAEDLQALQVELADVEQALGEAEQGWLEAQALLEEARS